MADDARVLAVAGVVDLGTEPIRIIGSLSADDDLQRVFVGTLRRQQRVDKVRLRATHLPPFVPNNQQGTRSHRRFSFGTHGAELGSHW